MAPIDLRVITLPDPALNEAELKALNPEDKHDRARLRAIHPFPRRKYIVATPSNCEVFANLARVLDQRDTGAGVFAKTRFGKTTANTYFGAVIELLAPGAYLVNFTAQSRTRHAPENAMHDLVRGMRLQIPSTCRHETRFDEIVKAIWMRAAEKDCEHVILTCDEATKYNELEYDGLMGLDNELSTNWGFRVTHLLWGQRSLDVRRTTLKDTRDDIVQRMMPRSFEFQGVLSLGECKQILEDLQTKSEFPPGSGKSFAWMFHPRAMDAGLNLGELAKPLWERFVEVAQEQRAKDLLSRYGIGMNWMSLAIEDLLTRHHEDDSAVWRPSESDYVDAVSSSNFLAAIGDTYKVNSDVA